jgi:hypothetical protein
LQRRDDDLGTVDQRRSELFRVLIDGFDYALGMLDLVNRVLKLLIQNQPVGNDDHAIEDLLVVFVVQTRQPVGQPGDAIGLTAAGGVLY